MLRNVRIYDSYTHTHTHTPRMTSLKQNIPEIIGFKKALVIRFSSFPNRTFVIDSYYQIKCNILKN